MANEKELADNKDQASLISDTVQDGENVTELSETNEKTPEKSDLASEENPPAEEPQSSTSDESPDVEKSVEQPPNHESVEIENHAPEVANPQASILEDHTSQQENQSDQEDQSIENEAAGGQKKSETEPAHETAETELTEVATETVQIAEIATETEQADEATETNQAQETTETEPIDVTTETVQTEEIATETEQAEDAPMDDEAKQGVEEELAAKSQETGDGVYSSDDDQKKTEDVASDKEENQEGNEAKVAQIEEEVDYSILNKEELLEAISKIAQTDEGFRKGKEIYQINERYDALFSNDKEAALNKFILDGGDKDDFKFKPDETSVKFEEYAKMLKGKRTRRHKEFEKEKEQNLELKTKLLERLRTFVDDDENTASIKAMKKMQEEWKAIGSVLPQHNKSLWANYNALMDRYYDHRSIYFELKELDRKKNLESKQALCQQAEGLDELENLNEAIKKLNELHDEFKHIGPIPKEIQEEVWTRFKTASDKVYAKRKDYVNHLKESQQENLNKKVILAERVSEFTTFTSEAISDWNGKSKELLTIQKEWEAIGSMPKEKAKGINKKFWSSFKTFFHLKSDFFKSLDAKREENLALKQELVDQALKFQESEDWDQTANALKELQKNWKEIGPVPEKQREPIYKKFKEACDAFFNRRRDHGHDVESSYGENLTQKNIICDKLEALINNDELSVDEVYQLQDEFNNIGFVPRKAIKSIQSRYQSAITGILDNVKNIDESNLHEFKSMLKLNKMKSSPHGDDKLNRKEHALRRNIQNLENDLSTWKNNLGFFKNSNNASDLLKDFETKIGAAEDKLVSMKDELSLIIQV